MRKNLKIIACQKGQTMLIVVLAIVIALTVGLSIASRSITNLKTTTEEINSQKALSAAEAGIEKALQKLTSTQDPITGSFDIGKSTFSTTVSSASGTNILLNGGNMIDKDQGIDLWFVNHDQNGIPDYSNTWSGNINIYWGQGSDQCATDATNTMAALEIVVVSGDQASPSIKRYAIDPCSNRASVNKFDAFEPGATVAEKAFPYGSTSISMVSGLVARIIPLYASTPIAVVANPGLPSQGSVVTSLGKSGSTERKITVFQGYPSLPAEYFPNNFFYHNL